ncbi:MAG TPA: PEP-CTERM sorting domain-containing protein [Candidatus Brocadiia bacterium]|nr:PEP-CTERM sorting domain-containing protein [Candidatus Brocadiia bacterium]
MSNSAVVWNRDYRRNIRPAFASSRTPKRFIRARVGLAARTAAVSNSAIAAPDPSGIGSAGCAVGAVGDGGDSGDAASYDTKSSGLVIAVSMMLENMVKNFGRKIAVGALAATVLFGAVKQEARAWMIQVSSNFGYDEDNNKTVVQDTLWVQGGVNGQDNVVRFWYVDEGTNDGINATQAPVGWTPVVNANETRLTGDAAYIPFDGTPVGVFERDYAGDVTSKLQLIPLVRAEDIGGDLSENLGLAYGITPEPGTVGLMATGLATLAAGAYLRRKREEK